MKSKCEIAIVALALAMLQSSSTSAARADKSGSEKLFAIADRLQKSPHLSVTQVESDTGMHFHHHGAISYVSDKPLDGVFRTVEVLTNPDLPMARRVTSVSLYLPTNGLEISREQVEKKFGGTPAKVDNESFGKEHEQDWGFSSLSWRRFKRKNGDWVSFGYDSTAKELLRVIEIVPFDSKP